MFLTLIPQFPLALERQIESTLSFKLTEAPMGINLNLKCSNMLQATFINTCFYCLSLFLNFPNSLN